MSRPASAELGRAILAKRASNRQTCELLHHSACEGSSSIQKCRIIVATGFQKPSIDWMPQDLFPTEGERSYKPPNLYLQTFSTEDWSVLLTNAAYMDAIGVVGNFHIGLYLRGEIATRPSLPTQR